MVEHRGRIKRESHGGGTKKFRKLLKGRENSTVLPIEQSLMKIGKHTTRLRERQRSQSQKQRSQKAEDMVRCLIRRMVERIYLG